MAKKQKDQKVYLSPLKMIYSWPSVLHILRKSKKINKKNLKNPGTDYYSEEFRYEWLNKKVKKMAKIMNVEIQYEGMENWLDRGVVLVPNHQSDFDPALLIALNDFQLQQPVAFIAKKEIWEDKIYSRFVNLIDCVPLDRENPRSAVEAFREAKELIVSYKRSLVIFPEGTRSKSPEMGKFNSAALKIAQMSNAPVIPVTIIDSYKVFNPNREKKVTVKVVFGKPIMPSKHISISAEALCENVKKEIIANMEKYKDKELNVLGKNKVLKKEKQKATKNKNKSFKNIFKIVE